MSYVPKTVPVNSEFIDHNVNLCIVIGARVSEGKPTRCAYVVEESTGEHREISNHYLVCAIAALAEGDELDALHCIANLLQDPDGEEIG